MSLALSCAGPTPAAPPSLRVHGADDRERAEVETFIRSVYAERFGARVRRFAPVPGQPARRRRAHRRRGRLPLRRAAHRCSSSATSTSRSRRAGAARPARRRRASGIVEVGHLAAGARRRRPPADPRCSARISRRSGGQWVVSTLTEELRHLFVRIGVDAAGARPGRPGAAGRRRRRLGPLLRTPAGGAGRPPAAGAAHPGAPQRGASR